LWSVQQILHEQTQPGNSLGASRAK
jgi:hypothetical protein